MSGRKCIFIEHWYVLKFRRPGRWFCGWFFEVFSTSGTTQIEHRTIETRVTSSRSFLGNRRALSVRSLRQRSLINPTKNGEGQGVWVVGSSEKKVSLACPQTRFPVPPPPFFVVRLFVDRVIPPVSVLLSLSSVSFLLRGIFVPRRKCHKFELGDFGSGRHGAVNETPRKPRIFWIIFLHSFVGFTVDRRQWTSLRLAQIQLAA